MQPIKYLMIVAFAFLCPFLQGQEPPSAIVSPDSLNALLIKADKKLATYNYKEAIETTSLLIKEAARAKDSINLAEGYDILGSIYYEIKDTIQAREKFEKGLDIAKKIKSDRLTALLYTNLGNIFSENIQFYEKGITFYKKSIEINDRIGQKSENLTPYVNIGWTYLDQEKGNVALPFLLKAKKLIEQDSSDYYSSAQIKYLLGRYHLQKKNYQLAETSLLEAIHIAEPRKILVESVESYAMLGKLYAETGDYEKAYASLDKYKALSQELYKLEKISEIEVASAQFNLQQYQRDLETAKKEKEYSDQLIAGSKKTTIIFVIASLVFLAAFIIIYRMLGVRRKYIKRLREKNYQLIEAKEKAEHLSKLKTQFFSTVSHELRTPLYGVIGIASILLEDDKIKTHRDDLKSLKFSADYLLALINDVLLLNKMDASRIRLEHTSFKLSTLLKSIARSFEFSLEQNNNKLHLDIDKQLPQRFIGDSVRLSQILMNLIGNAIKFNEEGNIWVTIKHQKKTLQGYYRAEFIIKDDGIGIPKNKQASIFEEFSQVENRNYNYQGTGLGLPIVKKLLALYGSEIKLESEVDVGTTFSFILDLEPAKLQEKEEIDIFSEEENNNELEIVNTQVLVVDDNRINQKITQKILENRNFKCTLANDGEEAIVLTKTTTYDLILMDIHMPNIDGIDATKAIRAFNKVTPIIALTAVEIDEIRQKILDAGMNDIILKPYDVSQFITTILKNLKPYSEAKIQDG